MVAIGKLAASGTKHSTKMEESEPLKLLKKLLDERKQFWSEIYPVKSSEEKEKYWISEIYDTMRKNGEEHADEYKTFSKQWYETVKSYEPNFDQILEKIAKRVDSDFDWKKYNARILR